MSDERDEIEVDYDTGEVPTPSAEEQVVALMTPIDLISYEPMMPEEVEELIRALSDRIERAPSVMTILYEDVHRAEERYQKEFSSQFLSSPNQQATFAREFAKLNTADLLHEWNLAKEKLRYAEWLQQALTSKLYGYLNINKSITATFMGQARR